MNAKKIKLTEAVDIRGIVPPVQPSTSGAGANVEPMQLATQNDAVISTVENASIDIEKYAQMYDGWNKVLRLLFIADHLPSRLKVDALQIVLNYLKENTLNTQLYMKVYADRQQAVEKQLASDGNNDAQNVNDHTGPLDQQWIELTNQRAQLKLEKLDTDLKNSKPDSTKESIRRAHEDLGDHHLNIGDLNKALDCYSRAGDYCTSGENVLSVYLNAIKVSIYLKDWSSVLSYVCKAEIHRDDSVMSPIATKLHCAAGLTNLASRKYGQAAREFVQCKFEHFSKNDSSDFLSVNNVAVYGVLCTLASLSRDQLRKVIQNMRFKPFLETEPQLREAFSQFYDEKYGDCLSILDALKDNCLLDLYLAPHVNTLYSSIRNRALIQFFFPYISVDLHRIATAFNTDVESMEKEIKQMILDGQLEARIDSVNKFLYAKDFYPETAKYKKARSERQAREIGHGL